MAIGSYGTGKVGQSEDSSALTYASSVEVALLYLQAGFGIPLDNLHEFYANVGGKEVAFEKFLDVHDMMLCGSAAPALLV